MIQLWNQQQSKENEFFLVYKTQENKSLVKYSLNHNLKEIIEISKKFPKIQNYFLLDESYFYFFRFDIFLDTEQNLSFQELNEIIKNKKEEIKSKTRDAELLDSYIDNIFVNGEKKKFIVGEKGEIFFRLYMIYLDKTCINDFNSIYGDILNYDKIRIIPQSLNTLLFLRKNIEKENFLLMYINENNCKMIKIRDGFYESIELLNFGIGSLKQMYKDNGIMNYRYKNYEDIESNTLAKNLIIETLQFYCQFLIKRIFEKNLIGTDLIIISSITKNTHFMETFNQEYSKLNNNYIVPFHYSNTLENFGKQREPEDMDPLIFINRSKEIKSLLV